MSTANQNQQAPSIGFPERGRVVVDRIVAENTRRRYPLQAEEGLAYEPKYSSAFAGGAAADKNDHVVYEVQVAPNARGRLASGQEVPSWAAVDPLMRGAFAQGTSGFEQSRSGGRAVPQRPGANPAPLGPVDGLLRPERPGTVYGRAIAPNSGGRGRTNEADCTSL
jgi:hypothetical protein